ncbi:hypothetical protein GCM10025867_47610 (plasmid) [Frondihabitans sucicola]|uniref:Uncharacterized protein n=1 Tax=Frondihabitans sucicola TaxID=1268041 RepID=A0ABM8GVM2_9MICO|nr:hypothetical protein [Frondihabitans sucicola]BDZ52520.1 hypothetical protein GCM10025867_47610 [Frondihabitans sucicola]
MQTSTITSEGVDTIEVGVVSGDLDIATAVANGIAIVTVAYSGALDTYTVVGSALPTSMTEADAHSKVIEHLGGPVPRDDAGNTGSLSLDDFVL